MKRWSRKYDKCLECGTIRIGYRAKGLCKKCYLRKWYNENLEKARRSNVKWCKENRKKRRESYRKFYRANSKKVMEKNIKYQFNRRRKDIHYKIKINVSSAVCSRLKSRLYFKKGKLTWNFLPYTVNELIKHLEKLFQPGMTWKNYGKWHIDHKIPDSSFNYKGIEDIEFQKCWALKNLQPLWAMDNLRKSNKIIN